MSGGERLETGILDELEVKALTALVASASEGNATAAAAALTAIQRVREKGSSRLHATSMARLAAEDTPGLAAYLASLGVAKAEVAARLGRRLSTAESEAWEQAQGDRLLEVRAVELGQMRAGGKVPRWATRKL